MDFLNRKFKIIDPQSPNVLPANKKNASKSQSPNIKRFPFSVPFGTKF
jgi:hypothetical protein